MYCVEWIPAAELARRAKGNGMPEGDDCVLDYAEAGDVADNVLEPDFDKAVAIAREKLRGDFFGSVRLERVVKVKSRVTGERWEEDAVWHVNDDEVLDPDNPHERVDLELYGDDRIVA